MRFLPGVAIAAALFSMPALAGTGCLPATNPVSLAGAPYFEFTDKDAANRFLNVPAVAPVSGTKLLLGNFVDILLFDTEAKTIGRLETRGLPGKIQPAGVAYEAKEKLVFSADYLLNKVSIFRFDGSSLDFLFEIPGIVSPEGVAFDEEARILSVAEYDGHGASAWVIDIEAKSYRRLWRHEVGYAHGVTTMGGRVYVTGLLDRQIHVFDQASGAKIETYGSQGWNPKKLQFLWPTSIAPDGQGNLIVADAESGYVSVIDPKTKEVRAVIGGAGPGRGGLSQPYNAVVADGKLTIVSTKDERFVSIDYPSLCVTASYVRHDNDWAHFDRVNPPMQADEGDYMWSSGPEITFFGNTFVFYNATLRNKATGNILRVGSSIGPNGYVQYKQMQYISENGYEYLFSPYAYNGPSVMARRGGRVFVANFRADLGRDGMIKNCWAANGIVCAERDGYDLPRMREILGGWIDDIEVGRCANGFVPASVLDESLRKLAKISGMEVTTAKDIFMTDQGKAFYEAYASAPTCDVDLKRVTALGKQIMTDPRWASIYELSIVSAILPSESGTARRSSDGDHGLPGNDQPRGAGMISGARRGILLAALLGALALFGGAYMKGRADGERRGTASQSSK